MRRTRETTGGWGARALREESGGALVMALLAVMVVAGLAASFMQFSSAIHRRQIGAIDKKKSFYMAEAGLSEAFVGLRLGKTGAVGSPAAPAAFGDGLFWVDATELGDDLVQIESTGMVGSGSASLSMVAQRGHVSVASLGVFAADELVLGPGTVIDGYDSADGTYAEQAVDPDALTVGRLGSNGAVLLAGTAAEPTIVRGDVMPGPQQTASVVGQVTITGSSDALAAPVALPPVVAPELELVPGLDQLGGVLDPLGGLTVLGAVPTLLGLGNGHVPVLRVESGAQAVLEGPTTLTIDELIVEGGGELVLDATDGPIELFVKDALTFADGSALSFLDEATTGVSIQVEGDTATPVLLAADTPFYGVLYAPEADVEVGEEFEIFGSIVGKSLTFAGSCRAHFDVALAAEAARKSLPRYVSWRILELEQSGAIGVAPIDRLGLTVADLLQPATAHADQLLELTYVDTSGALQVFNGLESTFPWSDVAIVITGSRDGQVFGIAAATSDGSSTEAAYDFGVGAISR